MKDLGSWIINMKVLYSEYHYRRRQCWKEYPKCIFNFCLILTHMYLISHIELLMKHKPLLIEFAFIQLIVFYSLTSQDPVHELRVPASLHLCLLLVLSVFGPKTLKGRKFIGLPWLLQKRCDMIMVVRDSFTRQPLKWLHLRK